MPPTDRRRIVVVGGAGSFGRRLVDGLVSTTGHDVIVAGRSLERAEAAVRSLVQDAGIGRVRAARVDRDDVDAGALAAIGADIVVDAAGPFQDGRHRLPRAAIEAGLHYVDLADSRAFVAGFGELDAAARAAGTVALTGASSTPALSNAALDRLTAGWRRVDAVEIAILPGNRAPRGLSVVIAILSYAGQPVPVMLHGGWPTRPGWGLLTRERIADLGPRWLSLCETPDLDIVPARFPTCRTALFRAGLELPALHLGLWVATLAVRVGWLRSLTPFAHPFRRVAALLGRLGTDRGGMQVEVRGLGRDGRPVLARWTLVAEAGDGPYVPTLPALAVIRQLATGTIAPGARACAGMIEIESIEAEMRRHRIRTTISIAEDLPLFARALGAALDRLPEPVRRAHAIGDGIVLVGEADVSRGRGFVAAMVAAVIGLPDAGSSVPVRVSMERRGATEVWTRTFAGRSFGSVLVQGRGPGRMRERFGVLTFDLVVRATENGLSMEVAGWRIGPMPLPLRLAPQTVAREDADAAGRFRFDVSLALPWFGFLVRYAGWLVPEIAGDDGAGPERR